MESAVIVRVMLPDPLDRLRQRCVRDAALGMQAHVTLLYPFVEAAALSKGTRRTIESIASGHRSFRFELSGPFQWPDTVYAAVEPAEHFLAIHRELAAAFPGYPIYGRPGFVLSPHVTIADGQYVDDPSILEDASWSDLPVAGSVTDLEVLAEEADQQWRTVWTVPLGAPGP